MLGLLTSPLYLLPSGSIQVYHAILFVMTVAAFIKVGGLTPRPVVIFALAFWAYVIVRQILFIMATAEAAFTTLLYPTLNMIVFLGVYTALTEVIPPRGLKGILQAIAAALVFETGYIFIENGSLTFFLHNAERSIGTFNNPNQLGYFAVLMGCAYVSIATSINGSKLYASLFVSLAYLLAIISLSKAAMLAISPLMLLAFISWGRGIRSSLLKAAIIVSVLVLLALSIVLLASQFENLAQSDNEVIRRLALIGQDSDDNLIDRGYALLLNPDWRIIFGYGEGYYDMRFGNEVHSTLANVITSFGVVGFVLFSGMILSIVQNRIVSLQFGLLGLVFAYGLTHNGLRNTLFWVFLAIIAWSARYAIDVKSKPSVCSVPSKSIQKMRAMI